MKVFLPRLQEAFPVGENDKLEVFLALLKEAEERGVAVVSSEEAD